ncbi:MAG: hypothetical protein QM662_03945 [Gordonia sp. (in: high G+C Gram-positive bacteria)]
MPSVPTFTALPGERIIHQSVFSPALFLKHLNQVIVVLTDQRVYIAYPHTLFLVIPFGGVERSIPLESIADVGHGRHADTKVYVYGISTIVLGMTVLFGVASLLGGGAVLLGLLLVIGGGLYLVTGNSQRLLVGSNGGALLAAPAGSAEVAQLKTMQQAILAEVARVRRQGPGAAGLLPPVGLAEVPVAPIAPAGTMPPAAPFAPGTRSQPVPTSPPAGQVPTGQPMPGQSVPGQPPVTGQHRSW